MGIVAYTSQTTTEAIFETISSTNRYLTNAIGKFNGKKPSKAINIEKNANFLFWKGGEILFPKDELIDISEKKIRRVSKKGEEVFFNNKFMVFNNFPTSKDVFIKGEKRSRTLMTKKNSFTEDELHKSKFKHMMRSCTRFGYLGINCVFQENRQGTDIFNVVTGEKEAFIPYRYKKKKIFSISNQYFIITERDKFTIDVFTFQDYQKPKFSFQLTNKNIDEDILIAFSNGFDPFFFKINETKIGFIRNNRNSLQTYVINLTTNEIKAIESINISGKIEDPNYKEIGNKYIGFCYGYEGNRDEVIIVNRKTCKLAFRHSKKMMIVDYESIDDDTFVFLELNRFVLFASNGKVLHQETIKNEKENGFYPKIGAIGKNFFQFTLKNRRSISHDLVFFGIKKREVKHIDSFSMKSKEILSCRLNSTQIALFVEQKKKKERIGSIFLYDLPTKSKKKLMDWNEREFSFAGLHRFNDSYLILVEKECFKEQSDQLLRRRNLLFKVNAFREFKTFVSMCWIKKNLPLDIMRYEIASYISPSDCPDFEKWNSALKQPLKIL